MTNFFTHTFVLTITFFILFIFILAFAILAVSTKNSIYAILYLMCVFIHTMIVFLIWGVEFLSFIFIIIYVGLIAVLFLFIIMLLDLEYLSSLDLKNKNINYFIIISNLIGSFMLTIWLFLKKSILNYKIVLDKHQLSQNEAFEYAEQLINKFIEKSKTSPKFYKEYDYYLPGEEYSYFDKKINDWVDTIEPGTFYNVKEGTMTKILPGDEIPIINEDSFITLPMPDVKPSFQDFYTYILDNQKKPLIDFENTELTYEIIEPHLNLTTLGQTLYTDYAIIIVIIGLILIIGLIGAVVLTKGITKNDNKKQLSFKQLSRKKDDSTFKIK